MHAFVCNGNRIYLVYFVCVFCRYQIFVFCIFNTVDVFVGGILSTIVTAGKYAKYYFLESYLYIYRIFKGLCHEWRSAGYKVVDNLGFATVEEGVDKALEAGADIVVICSSDDEYAEYAIPAYKYLDGRAMFVVAGAPACAEDLKAAGIENFIHVRVDQLKTLKEYNAKLGI